MELDGTEAVYITATEYSMEAASIAATYQPQQL